MSLPLEAWNPFDLLIERDSDMGANVDLVFGTNAPLPPVVGVCLVEEHPEAEVARANRVIEELLAIRNWHGSRSTRAWTRTRSACTPREIEALIARMDVLITTRLHGLVLALKNGVPVIAIDAVLGGGKISVNPRWSDGRSCSLWTAWIRKLELGARARAQPEGRTLARACACRAAGALLAVRSCSPRTDVRRRDPGGLPAQNGRRKDRRLRHASNRR